MLLYLIIISLLGIKIVANCCYKSPTTVSGTYAPTHFCSNDLIFAEEFDILDLRKWQHSSTLSGGGNWEFQWYTNNRSNSFADNGILKIKPTLTSEYIGESSLYSQILDINGPYPENCCTDAQFYGCFRVGTQTNILNPIRSAQLRTVDSFSFKYGRMVIRAQVPSGDWLWPALWMLPRYNTYGIWPASGEIDLMESRGNLNLLLNSKNIGTQQITSTLQWGPDFNHNSFLKTQFEKSNLEGFNSDFFNYELIWSQDSITFKVNDIEIGSVVPSNAGFWKLGNYSNAIDNPWRGGTKMAPFDQKFYLIINLSVGGVAYFPDNAINSGKTKPWLNNSTTAALDFWKDKNNWLPTWNLHNDDESSFKIDFIRIYAL